jgi:hypothetical protein
MPSTSRGAASASFAAGRGHPAVGILALKDEEDVNTPLIALRVLDAGVLALASGPKGRGLAKNRKPGLLPGR